MSKYIVEVPEVYHQQVLIEAESFKEALELVYEGKGEEVGEILFHKCLDEEEAGVWLLDKDKGTKDYKKGTEILKSL
jgi:hypothetical protein